MNLYSDAIRYIIMLLVWMVTQQVCAQEKITPDAIYQLPSVAATQRFHYGKEALQIADLRIPSGSGPFPVAIILHGGCWLSKYGQLQLIARLATAFTQLGIATWNVEYRGIDVAGGGWPGTFQDVAHAVDYLRIIAPKYNLDLNRVVIIGHSAGGHLGLWVAARSKLSQKSILYSAKPLRIKGVVNLAGPGNLKSFIPLQGCVCHENVITNMMGGTPADKPERYQQGSPSELLPFKVKQILITGADDSAVPPILGQEYQQNGTQAGDSVQLIVVKDAGHWEVIAPRSNAWPIVKKSVLDLLKTPK